MRKFLYKFLCVMKGTKLILLFKQNFGLVTTIVVQKNMASHKIKHFVHFCRRWYVQIGLFVVFSCNLRPLSSKKFECYFLRNPIVCCVNYLPFLSVCVTLVVLGISRPFVYCTRQEVIVLLCTRT